MTVGTGNTDNGGGFYGVAGGTTDAAASGGEVSITAGAGTSTDANDVMFDVHS
jgi:hypothetical protein